jgi:hypothetical protein
MDSSMRLMIQRSRILYINELNRKIANRPVPHNNSFTENTTSAKQGRQYFTQAELAVLAPQALLPENYGRN